MNENEFFNVLEDCLNRMIEEDETIESIISLYPQYHDDLLRLVTSAKNMQIEKRNISGSLQL